MSSCASYDKKAVFTSPDNVCRLAVSNRYDKVLPLDPNAYVELKCRGQGSAYYLGHTDWFYADSAVRWDTAGKKVRVVLCSRFGGGPIFLLFSVAPARLLIKEDDPRRSSVVSGPLMSDFPNAKDDPLGLPMACPLH
jgi:hypothetical protein